VDSSVGSDLHSKRIAVTALPKANIEASRFFTSLHRLKEFDSQRVRVVVQGQLKLTDVRHWSNLKLDERVTLLNETFKSAYHLYYPRLSWYAHSGLTGVANLNSISLTKICSQALWLAGDFYKEVPSAMIQQFQIYRTDSEILSQMNTTAGIPFLPPDEEIEIVT
jgi:hypothetical protein